MLLRFLTLAVTALVARQGQLRDAARMEQDAGLLAAMVKLRFDSHRDGLIALRVELERGGSHDWLTFSNQVETLYPWLNYPAFTEFAFLHRIQKDNRTNFATVTRQHAHAPFGLGFPADRPEFWVSFPILFHHFVRQHDQPAPNVFTQWGLDVNQEATERDRLTWAWASDRPGTTRGGSSVWGPAPASQIRVYVPVLSPANTGQELDEKWQTVLAATRKKYEAELSPEEIARNARSHGKFVQLPGDAHGAPGCRQAAGRILPQQCPGADRAHPRRERGHVGGNPARRRQSDVHPQGTLLRARLALWLRHDDGLGTHLTALVGGGGAGPGRWCWPWAGVQVWAPGSRWASVVWAGIATG